MSEHNPDQLTPEQVGVADGWRLLNEEEIKECPADADFTSDIQRWDKSEQSWDEDKWCGAHKYFTYRTKLTPDELRKARGLEEKPEAQPFSFAEHFTEQEKNPAYWKELRSLTESELASLREEVARLKEESRRWINGNVATKNAIEVINRAVAGLKDERDKLTAENARLSQTVELMRTAIEAAFMEGGDIADGEGWFMAEQWLESSAFKKAALSAAPATGWVRREEMERMTAAFEQAKRDWIHLENVSVNIVRQNLNTMTDLRANLVAAEDSANTLKARAEHIGKESTWLAVERDALSVKLAAAEAALKKELIHGAASKAAHQGIEKRLADRLESAESERDAARAELATLLALCESFHREATARATLSGGQPRTPTAPASA